MICICFTLYFFESPHAKLDSILGFASFVFILAFILLIVAAIYVSPVICGSGYEGKVIWKPEEMQGKK